MIFGKISQKVLKWLVCALLVEVSVVLLSNLVWVTCMAWEMVSRKVGTKTTNKFLLCSYKNTFRAFDSNRGI